MNEHLSQGAFNVRRRLDGAVRFTCPPVFVVSPEIAVQIARAILNEAGIEVMFAEAGQTVIRPPFGRSARHNGNGGAGNG